MHMCLRVYKTHFRPSTLGSSDTGLGPGARWSRAWMKEIGRGLAASSPRIDGISKGEFDGAGAGPHMEVS